MTDIHYNDDDFVYVDPVHKEVVGKVEWTKDGFPKSLSYIAKDDPQKDDKKEVKKKSKGGRKFYPWGTYRSMKRIFRLEGKVKSSEPTNTLEGILPKALKDAFWE